MGGGGKGTEPGPSGGLLHALATELGRVCGACRGGGLGLSGVIEHIELMPVEQELRGVINVVALSMSCSSARACARSRNRRTQAAISSKLCCCCTPGNSCAAFAQWTLHRSSSDSMPTSADSFTPGDEASLANRFWSSCKELVRAIEP